MFCEGLGEECDMDIIDAVWPSSREEAQIILCRARYANPRGTLFAFVGRKRRERYMSTMGYHVWKKTKLQTLWKEGQNQVLVFRTGDKSTALVS